MIPDHSKNFIYVADTLPSKMPLFYKHFTTAITSAGIEQGILTDTSDIWAVDYMPSNLHLNADMVSCDLVLDGGNLVYEKDTLIVTDKIFSENSEKTKSQIIQIMENCFQARIIVIDRSEGDIFGHADGLVRFINGDTVLVNEPGL